MWKEDLVKCLEESTPAHSLTDQAIATKEPYLPKRVYKYRYDCCYSRDNLQKDTVWLATAESYNDPYDCWLTFPKKSLARIVEKRFVDEFVGVCATYGIFVSTKEAEQAKQSREPLKACFAYVQGISTATAGLLSQKVDIWSKKASAIAEDMISTFQGWRKITKVCSFSRAHDSILMWSHYAKYHKGFCLEYDLHSPEAENLRKKLFPVIYSSEMYDLTPFFEKMVHSGNKQFSDLAPVLTVIRKFNGWKYEKEWRAVSVEHDSAGRALAVPSPSRIFLGSKFEDAKSEELMAIIGQKKIPTYRMELAEGKFKLLAKKL